MDLILVVLSAYFMGKQVEAKGYSSFRWRIRHMSACIFTYTLVAIISLNINGDLMIAAVSGMLALVGLIIYRYQNVKNLEPADK